MKNFDARKLAPEQQKILRIKAVNMVMHENFTKRRVAQLLDVSRVHVGKWCNSYEAGGYDALESGRRGRRPDEQAKLQPWQCALVVRAITDGTPDQLKMPFVLWTRAAVRDFIERRFGILLAIRTVGDYLAKWNMTPQKTIERAYQQNPGVVKKWLEETYPSIKEMAKNEGAAILWCDETGVKNEANCVRSFSPEGKTPIVKKDGKRIRVNMISTVGNRGDVRFMIYQASVS